MIARAHGDHIHSVRPDGGPDRCHRQPSCTALPALLDALDAEPFSADHVRRAMDQLRADHMTRDYAAEDRQMQQWLDGEIERVLGGRAFGKTRALLEAQLLYLSWGETTIPLPPGKH